MSNMMSRFVEGRGSEREIDMLLELTKQVEGHTFVSVFIEESGFLFGLRFVLLLSSICALGDAAAWPIQGLMKHFRPEVEARIRAYREANG